MPGRIQPRQAAQALQPDNSASQTTPKQKNGRKSPLAQAPAGILRFPTVSTQLFGPTSNGNIKAQPNITQTNGHSRPSVWLNPNQAAPNQKNGALDVPLNLHKPLIDIQQAEESEKERRTTFDAPDEPWVSKQKPKPEERVHETQPVTVSPRLRLKELLAQYNNLPSQAVILGVCDDGLPLALDLSDAAPGAVLAIGDVREEQIGLLRTAVASVCSRNSPRGVQFLVFSHQPESWQTWITQNGFNRHCIGIENAQEDTLQERILQLVDWAEQRRLGQRVGPPVLLVIDTLVFLPRLEYEIRFNLDWLIKEGPQVQNLDNCDDFN